VPIPAIDIRSGSIAASLACACLAIAQEPRAPTTTDKDPAVQHFATFENLRGKLVHAQSVGGKPSTDPASRDPSVEGRGLQPIGTIENVAIVCPAEGLAEASGGRERDTGAVLVPTPEARALIRLSGESPPKPDPTKPEAARPAEASKCVAVPLRDLTWHASRMEFTVNTSADAVRSMPEHPGPGTATGKTGRSEPIRDDPARDKPGEVGRASGAMASKTHEWMGSELTRAKIETRDQRQGTAQGIVFDLARGELAFVLVSASELSRTSGDLGPGRQGEPGQDGKEEAGKGDESVRARFESSADLRAIPWSLVQPAPHLPTTDGKPVVLELFVTSDQISKAPSIDPSQLDKLDSAEFHSGTRAAFPDARLPAARERK
jgi:hypothetical protein